MPLGGKNSSPLAAGYRLKPSNTSSTSRGRACRGRLAGPRQFRAMIRNAAITRTDRLHLILFFCLYARTRRLGMGRKAMPYFDAIGAKLYFEESDYGYPIIFVLNSDWISVGGKP